MAKEVIIELKAKTDKIEQDVEGINKEIKTLNKNVDKTAEGFEGVEKASQDTAKGVKKIGTTLKAIGIGLLLAAFTKLKEVFEENSLNLTSSINYAEHDLLDTEWSQAFISYADLIDAGTYNEEVFYYIHDDVTNLSKSNDYGFSLSDYSDKNIYSWTHWDDDELYIEKIFSDIDKLIDLDFSRVYSREDAHIQIYKISQTADLDGIMGHAAPIASKDPNLASIEIIWKYFDNLALCKFKVKAQII